MMRPQASGNPNPELAKLFDVGARVFCVMGQQLGVEQQLVRVSRHSKKIVNVAWTRKGPYAYGPYADSMREIWRPRQRI